MRKQLINKDSINLLLKKFILNYKNINNLFEYKISGILDIDYYIKEKDEVDSSLTVGECINKLNEGKRIFLIFTEDIGPFCFPQTINCIDNSKINLNLYDEDDRIIKSNKDLYGFKIGDVSVLGYLLYKENNNYFIDIVEFYRLQNKNNTPSSSLLTGG